MRGYYNDSVFRLFLEPEHSEISRAGWKPCDAEVRATESAPRAPLSSSSHPHHPPAKSAPRASHPAVPPARAVRAAPTAHPTTTTEGWCAVGRSARDARRDARRPRGVRDATRRFREPPPLRRTCGVAWMWGLGMAGVPLARLLDDGGLVALRGSESLLPSLSPLRCGALVAFEMYTLAFREEDARRTRRSRGLSSRHHAQHGVVVDDPLVAFVAHSRRHLRSVRTTASATRAAASSCFATTARASASR